MFNCSFIHSGYFYSTFSNALLLRGTPDTALILCQNFTPNWQLRVKDLPKVPAWQLERDSNPRPFGRKTSNLPMSHHAPRLLPWSGSFQRFINSPFVIIFIIILDQCCPTQTGNCE